MQGDAVTCSAMAAAISTAASEGSMSATGGEGLNLAPQSRRVVAGKHFVRQRSTIRVMKAELSIQFLPINSLPKEFYPFEFLPGETIPKMFRSAGFIAKKINNSIDFLRHADETRFSNFPWDILGKLRHFGTRVSPETKLIPKVIWTILHILA